MPSIDCDRAIERFGFAMKPFRMNAILPATASAGPTESAAIAKRAAAFQSPDGFGDCAGADRRCHEGR
jgi:hypothetical protein